MDTPRTPLSIPNEEDWVSCATEGGRKIICLWLELRIPLEVWQPGHYQFDIPAPVAEDNDSYESNLAWLESLANEKEYDPPLYRPRRLG